MGFFDRIVVGVEYPTTDSDAKTCSQLPHLQRAFELAATARCPLTLLTVLPQPRAGWFTSEEESRQKSAVQSQAAAQLLKELAERFTASTPDHPAKVDTLVAQGDAWMEIIRAAGSDGRTLVLCGTRCRSLFSQMIFGSTGMKLLRYAPGPVWLVHPSPDQDDRLDILATSDLTDVGLDVLQISVAIAGMLPSRLSVLSVAESGIDGWSLHDLDSGQREQAWAKARMRCEELLREQLSQTDYRTLQAGVQVHTATGDADVAILQAVSNLNSNLVVMASRARGGAAGIVLGNTAERLLRALPCSVLVIKPDDFVCPFAVE